MKLASGVAIAAVLVIGAGLALTAREQPIEALPSPSPTPVATATPTVAPETPSPSPSPTPSPTVAATPVGPAQRRRPTKAPGRHSRRHNFCPRGGPHPSPDGAR